MKINILALLFITVGILLVACDTEGQYWATNPPTTVNPIAKATEQAYLANNSAATANAHIARQTAISAEATRQIQEQLNGTTAANQVRQEATQAAVIATDYHLSFQGTAQGMIAQATLNAAIFNATGTVASAQAAADATSEFARAESQIRIIAEEAERLELANRAEEAAIRRDYILLVGILIIVGIVVSGIMVIRIRSTTPVVVETPTGPTILVNGSHWMTTNTPPLMLPEPAARPLLPQGQQLPQFPKAENCHIMIAGETGSGKSTAARAFLQHRQNVVVLDPHYKPGSWGNVCVIGAERDYDSIGVFMEKMQGMLTERYVQRAQGKTNFSPITVAADEMPSIVMALGRQIADYWREWLREGRKVGLFFVAMTQSTRVKTLGIEGEGDLLENFAYVLMLGRYASGQHPQITAGQGRPAILRTVHGVRPVTVPLIQPSGNGKVFKLARPNKNGTTASNNLESLIEQYRDQVKVAYWQYVDQNGEEPSNRFLSDSIIGYSNGRTNEVISAILEQMRPKPATA